MSEALRVYVQQDGTVPSTCPACGAERPFQSDKIGTRGRPVELRCSCGNRFSVLPEFRRAYRRETNLRGTYTKFSSENEYGQIIIKNMSMTGVGFTTESDHRLGEGDELMLRFMLDDRKDAKIEAGAVVVRTHGEYVGCKFKKLTPHQEEDLVSFLIQIP